MSKSFIDNNIDINFIKDCSNTSFKMFGSKTKNTSLDSLTLLIPFFLMIYLQMYLAFRERLHTPSLDTLDITCSSPDVQHCNVSGHQSSCSHVMYIYCDGACMFKLVLSVVVVVVIPFLLYNVVIVKV